MTILLTNLNSQLIDYLYYYRAEAQSAYHKNSQLIDYLYYYSTVLLTNLNSQLLDYLYYYTVVQENI